MGHKNGEYVAFEFSSADASAGAAVTLKDADGNARTLASNERLLVDQVSGTVASGAIPAKLLSGTNVLAALDSGHDWDGGPEGAACQIGVTPTIKTAAAGQTDITGTGRITKGKSEGERPSWREARTAPTK